jgi:hypothetical protein
MARRSWFVACAALLAALSWSIPSATAAASDALLNAQLAAGEFAPALELARNAADPRQRDAWLAQIAAAQAEAGALDAALRSAADIGDDRARARTLARTAAAPLGAQGGGPEIDFDSLIDLITSTVQPTTWDGVGGPGSVAPFPTGVWVDPHGVLTPLLKEDAEQDLAALRKVHSPAHHGEDARRASNLRMVSLPRLERQVALALAAGRQPTEAMQTLAGLQRIQYVFAYPETGDLVLAGPAGDWTVGPEGLLVGAESGQPVLRLDDLVVVFRHMLSSADAKFGCMITPRQDALARVQEFLADKHPIQPEQRRAWLEKLRAQLGKQNIEVYGLDPRTRAARVMVEADYRMKLVGMGLEPGVLGVESYLAMIKIPPGQQPPPMGVLRWWFTLNYDAVGTSRDRLSHAIRGQGVKVLSENERLTAEGKRVHTGQAEALTAEFAASFTAHFGELCRKYPIYAELRNLCDLALAAALVREEKLADKCGWHMATFGDPQAYVVELGETPKEVDTVINHRVINRVHIVAGVSGGVSVRPADTLKDKPLRVESYPSLANLRGSATPKKSSPERWWWD